METAMKKKTLKFKNRKIKIQNAQLISIWTSENLLKFLNGLSASYARFFFPSFILIISTHYSTRLVSVRIKSAYQFQALQFIKDFLLTFSIYIHQTPKIVMIYLTFTLLLF